LAEAALGLLLLPPVPNSLEILVLGELNHFLCGTVNAFLNHYYLAVLVLGL
jgi:hypothetical protein